MRAVASSIRRGGADAGKSRDARPTQPWGSAACRTCARIYPTGALPEREATGEASREDAGHRLTTGSVLGGSHRRSRVHDVRMYPPIGAAGRAQAWGGEHPPVTQVASRLRGPHLHFCCTRMQQGSSRFAASRASGSGLGTVCASCAATPVPRARRAHRSLGGRCTGRAGDWSRYRRSGRFCRGHPGAHVRSGTRLSGGSSPLQVDRSVGVRDYRPRCCRGAQVAAAQTRSSA
jgi:hypothetical protein